MLRHLILCCSVCVLLRNAIFLLYSKRRMYVNVVLFNNSCRKIIDRTDLKNVGLPCSYLPTQNSTPPPPQKKKSLSENLFFFSLSNSVDKPFFKIIKNGLLIEEMLQRLFVIICIITLYTAWERSGSVVECLTRDRGAAGSSLTGVTVLCH